MNYTFSKSSATKIKNEASEDLTLLLNKALELTYIDFGVVTVYRGKTAQNKAYSKGLSDKQFPNSRHNHKPSQAADLIAYAAGQRTYKMDYYLMLAGAMFAAFKVLQSENKISKDKFLRWGGDWDSDTEVLSDQRLDDGMHFEIRTK